MEEKLISLVQQNKFLYDKTSKHYKNIYLRDNKFSEFEAELNISAGKLKQRWRTLRDKFYKELKMEKCPSGSGASFSKKWKWMEQLMFLKDVTTANDNTSGNYSRCESPDVEIIEDFHEIEQDSVKIPQTSRKTSQKKHVEMLQNAHKDFQEIVAIARNAFSTEQQSSKTTVDIFLESCGNRIKEANITSQRFGHIQAEIIKILNENLYS